ncbi:serine/threonine-protein kinase GRIK2-like [Dioscorea cayenensis subsp. rotundata]|uniref:Serine/threonine-protein kinase GRIK2-like n=1 Tax=Dioscorea cayennensis subsp. rotundata TaxID=55577 RepID=A0AB40BDL4_DIOCR|nr:serine/threonine-protein kinase GRIK2-like [Dioscorea cayenensis subsp. rotundata]
MSGMKLADFDRDVGCCSCLGFLRKSDSDMDRFLEDEFAYERMLSSGNGYHSEDYEKAFHLPGKDRVICREHPVKETTVLVRSENADGHRMVNEYVRECNIGHGSYGKVVLYQSNSDGKQYAIKCRHFTSLDWQKYEFHLLKQLLQMCGGRLELLVSILKTLQHPNIVNLVEVIDDPDSDHFYMVLEYVEGKLVYDASGMCDGIEEDTARRYLRDIISGLMYLHAHDIVHGDIKPENILVTGNGTAKICDFSVSHAFGDGNDELRRSPGTPVFTAPECCFGSSYHGKAADVWAVGVTLYCMIFGKCPFIGDCLQDTYDKIVNSPLELPEDMDFELSDLLQGLLCKDPKRRVTLNTVAEHPWVVREDGPLPRFSCRCKSRTIGAKTEIIVT